MAVERVDGVALAEFSFERGEGFVSFDTTKTSVDEIVGELQRLTDFTATERPTTGGR